MSSLVQTALPDLANLRDLGGLRTRDGRRTRTGRLLRSATPYFLDAAQATTLTNDVGVRLRIDLRSRGEVAGATNEHLACLESQVLHAPMRSGGAEAVPVLSTAVAPMVAHYLRLLEHAGGSLAAAVGALAVPDHLPALVHCTLGKDRTGAMVAVVLSAVGVVDEEIVADYARTHEHTGPTVARLRTLPGYAERLAALPAESLSAVPETMTGFLAGLDATYGGARAYLRSVGVEVAVLDRVTANLVEQVAG